MIFLLLLSVFLIIILTARFKLHPFLALLLVGIGYGIATGMPLEGIIQSINDGFGGTLGKIGLVIVLGVIIGTFLENSGGAFTMAEKILKVIGKKRVPTAMGIIGYHQKSALCTESMQGFLHISCEDIRPSNHKRLFLLNDIRTDQVNSCSKQLSLSCPPSP